MNRRDFIKQTSQAAAATAIIGGGVLFLGNRRGDDDNGQNSLNLKNYQVEPLSDKPALAAVTGNDWRKTTAAAIAAIGGIEHFIAKGDKVCIKPNIGWDRTPELGANTHPEVVTEIIDLCLKAGASKVIVVDVTCNSARRTYNRSGIKDAAEKAGAEVLMENESLFAEVDFGLDSLGKWQVLKPILECDKLINVPVVKHHSLSGMTAAMKNWFGAVTGPRNRLHQGIDDNIAELGRLFQPTLTIEDATRVLQRNGPTGGRIDDVITYNAVIASTDQVAADSYVTRYLSKKPGDFDFIANAEQLGVGISKPADNKIAEIEV